MNSILEVRQRHVLWPFLRRDTLLAFDYDGTLAPLVEDPAQAVMRPETIARLRCVARHFPTVVITGRARHDAQHLLRDVPILEIVGNHGTEIYGAAPTHLVNLVARWRTRLAKSISAVPGASLEDKRYSLAIHFRRCVDTEAEAAVRRLALELQGARLIGGKQVLNILPAEAPDKGQALLRLCTRLGAPRAIFTGDDETDEAVFAIAEQSGILGLRVGPASQTLARFGIADQREIDALLDILLKGVRRSCGGGIVDSEAQSQPASDEHGLRKAAQDR